MGKARLTGRNVKIFIKGVQVGEIDKCDAKRNDKYITSRPIGASKETPNMVNGGWTLNFSGGKVDTSLSRVIHAQEIALNTIGYFPVFDVQMDIKHFNGKTETCFFPNTVLFGYEFSAQGAIDELSESFQGFAPERIPSVLSTQDTLKDLGLLILNVENKEKQITLEKGLPAPFSVSASDLLSTALGDIGG